MATSVLRGVFQFSVSVALGVCLVTTGTADVIYDTIALGSSGNHLVGLGTSTINQPANSFVVSGGDFTLDSITLTLTSTTIASGGTPDDYEIRIWDNDTDKPGTLLESFAVPGSDSLVGDTTVSSTLHGLLTNGSTYWISAALPDDLSFGLVATVNDTSSRAVAFSGAQSAPWVSTGLGSTFRMIVTGTPIPEPTSLLLASVAVLGALRIRRR